MHENEIIVLILGFPVLIFARLYRSQLGRLPTFPLLLIAYVTIFVGWCATLLEHLFWPDFLNTVEHLGYMFNGIILMFWTWFGLKKGNTDRND